MKKTVSFFAAFFLLCSMFPAHVVQAAGAEDLVKCSDFPAVYYVGDDGARYVFPNEDIYFSWYPDFSEVKTISCEDLASFPIGDRLVYRPGTSLVKVPSDPSVYAVESDGVLREIPSEEVAEDLFGDDWEGRVDDVSEAFWSSFTVGEPLEAGEIPEGMVFEDADGYLYRVGDDGSATEVDVVLDTDDEDVLQSFALPLDDVERRLGIAVALVRVDASAAIAVLEELLAELKPVRIDDDEVKDVDEVDEVEDGGEDDAQDAIEDAKEEIAEAEGDIVEDEADGKDIAESEVLLASAQEHLELAEAAYTAGDFVLAEEHADEAKHDAMWARGKAVESIDDEQEDSDDSDDEDEGGEDNDVSDDGDSEDVSEDSGSGEDSNSDEGEDESNEDTDESDEDEGSGQDSEDSSEQED